MVLTGVDSMIISASRRTDLPAFYSTWFMQRIQEGYFVRVNPFNARQQGIISLQPRVVEAFIFWSKNPAPLIPSLVELDERGYSYYFQFTLNSYPDILEPRLPPLKERLEVFKRLSQQIGAKRVLWRYDPIIFSDLTPTDYHLSVFKKIAMELAGFTEKCTISFLDNYQKVTNRFRKLRIQTNQLSMEEIYSFCRNLQGICENKGIQVATCGETLSLIGLGIIPGKCIDADLISAISGKTISIGKDPHQRATCQCTLSVDMGMYNSCSFACAYCYAINSYEQVQNNRKKHNERSPMLIGYPMDYRLP
jgi:hypothetical protein